MRFGWRWLPKTDLKGGWLRSDFSFSMPYCAILRHSSDFGLCKRSSQTCWCEAFRWYTPIKPSHSVPSRPTGLTGVDMALQYFHCQN